MSPFKERKGNDFFYHSLPVMFHCLCEKRYFPNISNSQNNWRIRKRHISGSEEKKREREREMKRETLQTSDHRPSFAMTTSRPTARKRLCVSKHFETKREKTLKKRFESAIACLNLAPVFEFKEKVFKTICAGACV
jgi:hypothetical protein